MDFTQFPVDPFTALVTHDSPDGHRHGGKNLSVLYQYHPTVLGDQGLNGNSHIIIVHPHNDDVVGIMSDGNGHCPLGDAIAAQQGDRNIAGGLVSFHHGNLDDVLGWIMDEEPLPVTCYTCFPLGGYHPPRKNVNGGDIIT
ncbi:hypothetical protein SDC9_152920 [bioreactor metagenome]|uniref:Uncharacterized protein n=1 Tax=bioreactor metagenome TaxID=1076179 RepID=A0A645EWT7_9ZZZZ